MSKPPEYAAGPIRVGKEVMTKLWGQNQGDIGFNSGPVFIAEMAPHFKRGTARLLAAAYNAFDSAGKKLGCNAVELAESMADGLICNLIEALEKAELILAKEGYDTAEFALPVAAAKRGAP